MLKAVMTVMLTMMLYLKLAAQFLLIMVSLFCNKSRAKWQKIISTVVYGKTF